MSGRWLAAEIGGGRGMNRPIAILSATLFALVTSLVSRTAAHAQANAAPTQQPVGDARFEFGGNAAEIPATFIGNLVFLPVHVNQGQPSLFELDSSAAVSSEIGRAHV